MSVLDQMNATELLALAALYLARAEDLPNRTLRLAGMLGGVSTKPIRRDRVAILATLRFWSMLGGVLGEAID